MEKRTVWKKIRNKNYFKCDIFFLIICDIFIIANSMFTFRNNRSKPLFSNDNFFTLSFLQANLSTSKKCSKLVFDESFRHLHRVFAAISLFSELVLSVLNPWCLWFRIVHLYLPHLSSIAWRTIMRGKVNRFP